MSLLDFFQELTGLFIGASAGLFMLGMFTRRTNSSGALAGALISMGVLYVVKSYTPLNFWLYSAVGFFSCVIPGYLLSLVLPGKSQTEGMTIYTKEPEPTNSISQQNSIKTS